MKPILCFEKTADNKNGGLMKRFTLAVILGVFAFYSAQASVVSFFIIETGLPGNGSDHQHSVFWENAFLDVFFEAGYIVCNSPILRMETKPSGDILRQVDMQEARNSGIDFLLIAQLDFTTNISPAEISFFIYKVNTREKIVERVIQGRGTRSAMDEYEYMKTVARGLITYIE